MSNTSEIGAFKVLSESGIASGVRRIEAVAADAAVEYLNSVDGLVRTTATALKVSCVEGRGGDGRGAALFWRQMRRWSTSTAWIVWCVPPLLPFRWVV